MFSHSGYKAWSSFLFRYHRPLCFSSSYKRFSLHSNICQKDSLKIKTRSRSLTFSHQLLTCKVYIALICDQPCVSHHGVQSQQSKPTGDAILLLTLAKLSPVVKLEVQNPLLGTNIYGQEAKYGHIFGEMGEREDTHMIKGTAP